MTKVDANPSQVLVVDDEEAARLMMTATLENSGLNVFTAANCEEARHIFENISWILFYWM